MRPYYRDGSVTLYCADCRDVLPTLAPGDFAAVVTDPPYGIAHQSNWDSTWTGTQIASDGDTTARDFVLAWAAGRPVACFGTWRAPQPTGTREVLVWDKGPASGMGDLSFPWKRSWEAIFILGEGWSGRRDEGVIRGHTMVTWESAGRAHPNAKPVTLLTHLIAKAPPGTILDPFAGSGSTLRAAKDLGRAAIGIEIEERYCEVIARRLSQEVLPFASGE